MANNIKITKGLGSWQFQQNYVERNMDNAAYSAAHPDDTLVLAGPPRKGSISTDQTQGITSLLAIGMLQGINFSQTKPTQPLMAIGSGRSFFVSGKAQTQWSISRLFVNGRNLNRVLYHNFAAAGYDASSFDDPAATVKDSTYFVNLDSELFYIPFGIGACFRNKAHDYLGALYCELSMMNSYAIGVNAGQNMILENVTGLADRVMPWDLSALTVSGGIPSSTLDQLLDFTEGGPVPNNGVLGEDDNQ